MKNKKIGGCKPISMESPPRRVLIKLSGELLGESAKIGINNQFLTKVAGQISSIYKKGRKVQISIVVGGGNFFRGTAVDSEVIKRVTADYMGMLATVINGMAMQDALEQNGVDCRLQTAFEIKAVGELFIRRRAIRHLEKGRVVIFAGGTGNPYFSTDTAAVLRASEIEADLILKATKVDGVYDRDPTKNVDAVRFDSLTFEEAIERKLRIMDTTAFALCMEKRIPIVVFNALKDGNIERIMEGKISGTIIC